ncbi:zinc-binding alcohol dehydrogenase family protein [Streptomyces sp. NPDC020799]|uniref:zinc-binding alcohol dehydrogenase family protein n=1 Tax=Streptomyces sp. NPDC020799 TaxID=3365091 RepID=UPI0034944409
MRAIMVRKAGGPEVLEPHDYLEPEPLAGHELVNVVLAGVNSADVHMREDSYVSPIKYPYVPGRELVGYTRDNQRVVALTSQGAYAEKALVYSGLRWDIPDAVTDEQALALAVDGQSAWHMLTTVLKIQSYEKVLIPAAASSLGSFAVQFAKLHGCFVVAMDNDEDKLQIARELGADAVVNSAEIDGLADRIRVAADGPVDAALELVGGQEFTAVLEALGFRGRMVIDGCSSRERENVQDKLAFGSKQLNGFWLPDLLGNLFAIEKTMQMLFDLVESGAVKVPDGYRYMLEHANLAHQSLTTGLPGKIFLDVSAIKYYY